MSDNPPPLWAPLFPNPGTAPGERAMWNHFDTVAHKTTNHVEGWHSKLNGIATSHPNIFKFINIIKSEQSYTEVTILQLEAGGCLRPKRRKYRNLESQIEFQKQQLLNDVISPLQYCDCISHLVEL